MNGNSTCVSSENYLSASSVDAFLSDYTCCVFLGIGWRAEVHPRTHPVNELEFDVIIGADGRRNTLPGKSACTDWEKCISNAVFKLTQQDNAKQHNLFLSFLSGLGG